MRRFVVGLVALCAAVALAGCAGRPPGVDGNLTDDWPAMAEAKQSVPVVGCYQPRYTEVWSGGDFAPVDCSQTHYVETVYIGTFTGADAQRSSTPDSNGPAIPGAYAQCQKGASDYLGGDWHTAYVWLGLVLPSGGAWRGGARWFLCDLIHYSGPFDAPMVEHGSLKGDLTGARTAAYGCLSTTEDTAKKTILTATPTDCVSPHAAEFAGTFTAPDVPFPTDKTARDKMLDNGCESVVATYLGFASVSQWQNTSVGWWKLGWTEDQWKLGDRTTQCFAYAFTKSGKFVGSVKGIKNQTAKG
jgi:hypothetical protein